MEAMVERHGLEDGSARAGARALTLALAFCGALAAAAAAREPARGPAGLTGDEAARRALATHRMRTLDGREFTLGALRGQVLVVNFWASWCPPCRRELPALDALQSELAARGARVVAVSLDVEPETARRFAVARGLKLPIAHDGPGGLARALDLQQVPTTLVLDRDGAITYATSGSDGGALAAVGAEARRLLAAGPASPAPGAVAQPTAGGPTP
jgi:thiol-disulfide isomerase/thioredoxin